MKLQSFGCSFMYGSDLSDCPHGQHQDHPPPSQLTWPALLAQHFDWEHQCHAWPGVGNLRIAETIIRQAYVDDPGLFVIGWSWIDRFDYLDDHKKPWRAWAWRSVMPNDRSRFAKEYFIKYHSQIRDQVSNVIMIKAVIDVLKSRKINFIMTIQDRLLIEPLYHAHLGIEHLQQEIRAELSWFQDHTFLEWAQLNGFPISSAMHPLDTAHYQAKNYAIANWCGAHGPGGHDQTK